MGKGGELSEILIFLTGTIPFQGFRTKPVQVVPLEVGIASAYIIKQESSPYSTPESLQKKVYPECTASGRYRTAGTPNSLS